MDSIVFVFQDAFLSLDLLLFFTVLWFCLLFCIYLGSSNSTVSDSEEKRDQEESSKVILVILASLILSYL